MPLFVSEEPIKERKGDLSLTFKIRLFLEFSFATFELSRLRKIFLLSHRIKTQKKGMLAQLIVMRSKPHYDMYQHRGG